MLKKQDFLRYKHSVRKKMESMIPELVELRKNEKEVSCFLCEDGHHFSRYFVYNFSNLVMLEEGIKVYSDISKVENILKRIIKYHILGVNYPNGVDKRIKELWVQYPEKLPSNVIHKGKKINLFEMMNDLQGTKHLKILLDMLGINDHLWREINALFLNNNEKIVLLITQPFAEDRLTTVEDKEKIYTYIADEYCGDRKLIVKPHPRETTNYNILFPDALVLDNAFPLELLYFTKRERKIDEAITVNSTAIMNIKELCSHIRVIGQCDITSKLDKRCSLKAGYYE